MSSALSRSRSVRLFATPVHDERDCRISSSLTNNDHRFAVFGTGRLIPCRHSRIGRDVRMSMRRRTAHAGPEGRWQSHPPRMTPCRPCDRARAILRNKRSYSPDMRKLSTNCVTSSVKRRRSFGMPPCATRNSERAPNGARNFQNLLALAQPRGTWTTDVESVRGEPRRCERRLSSSGRPV